MGASGMNNNPYLNMYFYNTLNFMRMNPNIPFVNGLKNPYYNWLIGGAPNQMSNTPNMINNMNMNNNAFIMNNNINNKFMMNNNMNMMNNNMMNMNNNSQNQSNMNNQNQNTQPQNKPQQKSFNTIKFMYVNRTKNQNLPITVQANSNMTVSQIVNNFRTKLGDDSIVISQYLLNDSTNLDPNSNDNICNLGIDDKSEIKAIV